MASSMTRPSSSCAEPDVRHDGCLHPTDHYFNPLTSFVLHMMYQNCGNIRRPRRVGLHKAIDVKASVREMDEVVGVIEEWEFDGEFESG